MVHWDNAHGADIQGWMDEQAWNEYLESLQVCLQSAISLILTMWEQDAR